jgi:hypothetical protein
MSNPWDEYDFRKSRLVPISPVHETRANQNLKKNREPKMSQNTDPQIHVVHQGGVTDTPKGAIPPSAADLPQPPAKAATTVAPQNFSLPTGSKISTVA